MTSLKRGELPRTAHPVPRKSQDLSETLMARGLQKNCRRRVEVSMEHGKFVGVDVSGNSIAVAVRPSGEMWMAEAGEDGVAQIADRLLYIRPDLVVLEAYGRFELAVAGTLAAIGLPFALIPPRNIRDFARALGYPLRSDQHQAGLLAQFAE